jgi:1-aminocyclopropane-1-carboxylate deaminase
MKDFIKTELLHTLPSFSNERVNLSILRLDQIHPIVSGNKWFKLKYYLQEALHQQKRTIATFGGAFSNHIVATAYAAKQMGLSSMGFIRGNQMPELSPTLQHAIEYGMKIHYVERSLYNNKENIILENDHPNLYWIMEGGYGELGAKGAAEILGSFETLEFTHILCAVGTGTMMAGLLEKALDHQQIIGISALKNNLTIEKEIRHLLNGFDDRKKITVLHDYHFGGYAKHPQELINFMKELWETEKVPTDIVYTAKLLYATKDLIEKKYFPKNSKLLLIHSGGLQGNLSLQPGRIPF